MSFPSVVIWKNILKDFILNTTRIYIWCHYAVYMCQKPKEFNELVNGYTTAIMLDHRPTAHKAYTTFQSHTMKQMTFILIMALQFLCTMIYVLHLHKANINTNYDTTNFTHHYLRVAL